jgi:hypothetical protein
MLTWPERIENYRKKIGEPYLTCANGWTVGTWFLGNSYEKKSSYYGAYQGNYLRRIDALFPDRREVLHLFSGRVDVSAFPGKTLDIKAELNPDHCTGAEECAGVPLHQFDFVLADPPYNEAADKKYGTPPINRSKVMKTLGLGLPPGAFVVWLDQTYPMYSKIFFKVEAAIGIYGSTNHRVRGLTIFRKVDEDAELEELLK